jgi:hypothetical protein
MGGSRRFQFRFMAARPGQTAQSIHNEENDFGLIFDDQRINKFWVHNISLMIKTAGAGKNPPL